MTANDNAPAGTGAPSENSGETSDVQSTTPPWGPSRRREVQESAPHAIDVTTLSNRPPRAQIIEGIWPVKSILGIAGEEGDGKTLLAEQILRQLLRGEQPLGFFDAGEAVPKRVLFVDTEMEEDDAAERNADMETRGLEVKAGQLYWYCAGGLALDNPQDVALVDQEIVRVGADLVWIDSGINSVSEAEDGTPVKKFFNNLSRMMRERDLVGVGLTLHTRKRGQGVTGRQFDDLFGSREWKGRLNTLIYIEGDLATSWKNRGGRLGRMWGSQPGRRPMAVLNRPGLSDDSVVPFNLTVPEDWGAVKTENTEATVREILGAEPDTYTKTTLAEKVGARKQDAMAIITRLQAEGIVVPTERGAKLRLATSESEQDAGLGSQGSPSG